MEDFYEEYVRINDIEQYFLHYPVESEVVVLFLHGGPGQSEAQFSHQTVLPERRFSVVYYDQRGAGKTQSKNKSRQDSITMDALLCDLKETVAYLRTKYPNKKLLLFGHSWGSVLGIEYLKTYADTVDVYVGMGQVVCFKRGERVAYEHCYAVATEKDRKKLSKLKDYPYSLTIENFGEQCPRFRKIQEKYGLTGYRGKSSELVRFFLKSPIFEIKDVFSLMNGMKANVNLLKYLADYDTGNETNFSVPVYFICGEKDWQVPSVAVEEYYNRISAPDKAFYWVENAGHLTDLDNAVGTRDALNSICERIFYRAARPLT